MHCASQKSLKDSPGMLSMPPLLSTVLFSQMIEYKPAKKKKDESRNIFSHERRRIGAGIDEARAKMADSETATICVLLAIFLASVFLSAFFLRAKKG